MNIRPFNNLATVNHVPVEFLPRGRQGSDGRDSGEGRREEDRSKSLYQANWAYKHQT